MKKIGSCSSTLLAMPAAPCPKHINDMDRRISERLLRKLHEQAQGLPNYYDPATMTPWMEDYYYGRKLR